MEIKDYIRMELDGLDRGLKRVTDTLTQDEIMWRPACGCNSMGLILFHIARSEDHFVAGALQNKPNVWETGKWYNKLNIAENEAGAHYTAEQVNAFPVPKMEDMLAYLAAVREKTLEYLDTLPPDGFELSGYSEEDVEVAGQTLSCQVMSATSPDGSEWRWLVCVDIPVTGYVRIARDGNAVLELLEWGTE